jgi:predicted esterase
MIERSLRTWRTARYYVLGTPGAAVREIWFVCHGYGQLAAPFAQDFEKLASLERIIVAPEALSRFYLDSLDQSAGERRVGATWMTREDRESEIGDYVGYLDMVHAAVIGELPAPGARVHVLGFSQGVTTVMRWLALGTARADALTLWAGGLPHDLALGDYAERFGRMKVTVVAGERDRLVGEAPLAAARARLLSAGIDHQLIRFAGGHRLDDAVLRQLAGNR